MNFTYSNKNRFLMGQLEHLRFNEIKKTDNNESKFLR